MSEECQLSFRNKCCCTCKYHIQDFHHCTTVSVELRNKLSGNKYVCSVPKGWIYMPPDWDGAHSDWAEHGICEMWTGRNNNHNRKEKE